MISRLLVLLAILCVSFLILDFTFFWRDGKVQLDPYGCKHHCEWQLAKMNETFNTLITVCEKKLQQLHDSDMNLAIIREQLHKEILELFSYEFQTFQRLHSARVESVPQFCSEYCKVEEYKECKKNMTNSHYQIQMLLQRQRWLRIQIRRRLQFIGGNISSTEPEIMNIMGMLWSHTFAMIIVLVALFVTIIRPSRSRLATLTGEKERIETQLHMAQTQLMQIQAESRTTRPQETEEPRLDSENQCLELSTSDEEIIISIVERNSHLESWNENLLRSEQQLKSRLVDLCSEKDLLCQEFMETLALRDKSLQNIDKFWHQRLNEERKARKTAEEKERDSVEMIKAIESKHQWQLAREIIRYQSSIQKLESKLKQVQERDAEGEQIMIQRQEERERKVRELERETKCLQLELEGSKMDLYMQTERKNHALAHVSDLEKEVKTLKAQVNRLVEGYQKKGSKTSRLVSFPGHHQDQSAQESSKLQVLDSRLEDIRQDFESRFTQLQSKFDDQVTRDSKELHLLRTEHQKLCESLELANKQNIQLTRRLAYQEPIQQLSYRSNETERISRMRRWISPRQRLLRQRSSSIERSDSFLTQPELESIPNQEYSYYNYLSSC